MCRNKIRDKIQNKYGNSEHSNDNWGCVELLGEEVEKKAGRRELQECKFVSQGEFFRCAETYAGGTGG